MQLKGNQFSSVNFRLKIATIQSQIDHFTSKFWFGILNYIAICYHAKIKTTVITIKTSSLTNSRSDLTFSTLTFHLILPPGIASTILSTSWTARTDPAAGFADRRTVTQPWLGLLDPGKISAWASLFRVRPISGTSRSRRFVATRFDFGFYCSYTKVKILSLGSLDRFKLEFRPRPSSWSRQ